MQLRPSGSDGFPKTHRVLADCSSGLQYDLVEEVCLTILLGVLYTLQCCGNDAVFKAAHGSDCNTLDRPVST